MAEELSITLEIGDRELRVTRLRGREAISELFTFAVDVTSERDDGDVLSAGATATLRISRDGQIVRSVFGVLRDVHLIVDNLRERPSHRVELVPRAHRATLIKAQRIVMDKSLADIVRETLKRVGIGQDEHVWNILSEPPAREFTVQYAESDMAFMSRLCEHWGVAYHFEHADADRILFSDQNSGFGRGCALPISDRLDESEVVYSLSKHSRMIPSVYVVYDYNYRTPDLEVKASNKVDGQGGGVLEYGAHVKNAAEAELIAEVRSEERACRQLVYRGESSLIALASGTISKIEGGDNLDGSELLITRVEHQLEDGTYSNSFEAIDYGTRYRPARATAKPRITGIVTGVVQGVDGTSGSHALIDGYGRYTVQFHFDKALGALQGKVSRPVRKAQPLAGTSEGMHFPLKPGTEVALAFANGDPDRPIIVGALPNRVTQSVVNAAESRVNRIKTNDGITIQFGTDS